MKNRFLKTSLLVLSGLCLSAGSGYSLESITLLNSNRVLEISLPEGITPHVYGNTVQNGDEELLIPNLLESTLTVKFQETTLQNEFVGDLNESFALQKFDNNQGVFFALKFKAPKLSDEANSYKVALDSLAEGGNPLQIVLSQESVLIFETGEGATMQVVDESEVADPLEITTTLENFLMLENEGDTDSNIRIRFRTIEEEAEITPEPTPPVATPEATPEATPAATPDVDEDINTDSSSGGCSLSSVSNAGGLLPTVLMLGMGLVSVLRRKKS